MHPHELVRACMDELRLYTGSTDPTVGVRHHALCSVLLRGGGVKSCVLMGAYCYCHMGRGFTSIEGTDVLWIPLDTLIRSVFQGRYCELTRHFAPGVQTHPLDYLSTDDTSLLREIRASSWSTGRRGVLSEGFLLGSLSPPHSFWKQLSACMLDCDNPCTPAPSGLAVHHLRACCEDVLGRAATEYDACLLGGGGVDGEFLCLLDRGHFDPSASRHVYRITGVGFMDGGGDEEPIAECDIYWHVVFKAVGSTARADLYQPASQWVGIDLTMANLMHVAAFARQMPSAGSLTGQFGMASLADGWAVDLFVVMQAGRGGVYEVLVRGRGIVAIPQGLLAAANCRALA